MSDQERVTLEFALNAWEELAPIKTAREIPKAWKVLYAYLDQQRANAQPSAQQGEPVAYRRCKDCNAPRKGDFCWKCGGQTFEPCKGWEEADLPCIDRIRELAKEVGYAIAVHGSQERDLDLVAAPWTDAAVGNYDLIQHVANGLGAKIIDSERKPHGRCGVCLQMNGYYKLIDLSICPRASQIVVLPGDANPPAAQAERVFTCKDSAIRRLAVAVGIAYCDVCGGTL